MGTEFYYDSRNSIEQAQSVKQPEYMGYDSDLGADLYQQYSYQTEYIYEGNKISRTLASEKKRCIF